MYKEGDSSFGEGEGEIRLLCLSLTRARNHYAL